MQTRVGLFSLLLVSSMMILAAGKVLFREEFGPGWETHWTKSSWNAEQQGAFVSTKGKWYGDEDMAFAIQATGDSKFFELSTKFPEPINTGKNPLVLQYSVKFEQVIDCGGGYIKAVVPDFDPATFGGKTPVLIMFGPDICGSENRIHLLLDKNGTGYLWKKKPAAPNDKLTHIYTVALYPNQSYAVYLDAIMQENGTLSEDWDMSIPKTIPDPNDKKPDVLILLYFLVELGRKNVH